MRAKEIPSSNLYVKKPASKAGISVCSDSNPPETPTTSESFKKSDSLLFVVYGEPVALGRHRTSTKGGRIHNYTPQKSADAKEHIAYTVKSQYKGKPVTSPIRLTLHFYFQAPKSMLKMHPNEVAREIIPMAKRIDLDNAVKLVGDALNKILWADDSQICEIYATKVYSDTPRTFIYVELLPC